MVQNEDDSLFETHLTHVTGTQAVDEVFVLMVNPFISRPHW